MRGPGQGQWRRLASVDAANVITLESAFEPQPALGNASAELAVFGLCDGCLLQTPSPPFASGGPSCTTDATCPPLVGLPADSSLSAALEPVVVAALVTPKEKEAAGAHHR